jgi:hypothetical protein
MSETLDATKHTPTPAYATEAGRAVSLEVVKDQVVVTLFGPRVKGGHGEVNETVLEFAQKLG